MKVLDAALKTDREIYNTILIETIGNMEYIEELEDKISDNSETSYAGRLASKQLSKELSRFERNIKLLNVLKK